MTEGVKFDFDHPIKQIRAWWRKMFDPHPPARCLPSIGWAHTRKCIGGVSYEQAKWEESAWTRSATERWLAGERM